MKVKFRFFLFFLAIIVLASSLFAYVLHTLHNQNNSLRNSLNEQFTRATVSKCNREMTHFMNSIKRYVDLQSIQTAIKLPNDLKVKEELAEVFKSSQADIIYLVDDSYNRVFVYNKKDDKAPRHTSFTPLFFSKLTSDKPLYFFSYEDELLMEYSAIVIPTGYLIFMRVWDKEYLQYLRSITDSEIYYQITEQDEHDLNKHDVLYVRPLSNWEGAPLINVYFVKDYYYFSKFSKISIRFYIVYALFVVGFIATFFYFFKHLINEPLDTIAKALSTADVKLLKELENSSKIFRDIADLITQFFRQQDELHQEISKRQVTEVALGEQQRVYSTLLNNFPGGAFRCLNDKDWTMLFMSHGFKNFLGAEVGKLLAGDEHFSYEQCIHPEDRIFVRDIVNIQLRKRNPYEIIYRVIDVHGVTRWVLERGEGVFDEEENLKFIEGFITDITEQKEAADHYKTLFINSSVAMIITNPADGKIYDANNAALSFYGYSKEEIGSMNIDQINTITLQEVSKTVRKNSPTPDFHCVFKHRLKNGSIRDVETFSIPITINDQHYVYSIILDITDRLEAEKQIAENEEFLNNMFNTIQDGILVTDLDFNVLAANPTIYKWYSLDESIVGKKCYDVLKTEGKSCSVCPVRNAIKTGSLRKERLELIMKDGKTYHRENYAYPMRNGKGEIASIMQYIRDVTDIRKMEEELLKMEKLDSLSTLAAGIAHDFNNLLNGLFGYIEMAKIYYLNPEKVNSYLASALSTFERAKGLTQQLSTFASGSPLEKKIISVKDLLYSTVNFALSGSNVRAIYEIEEDLWNCNIDKNQIGQVIDNIVINARQAMPNGGIINVAAQNVPPEEEHEWRKEGENYVKVTITDTGKGIPEHLLKKIFDPFFTTKQKGSGLGLATSYSIINKHKGRIEASSTLGIGTTFTIYFPTSFEEING